jgi:hypothetical protein
VKVVLFRTDATTNRPLVNPEAAPLTAKVSPTYMLFPEVVIACTTVVEIWHSPVVAGRVAQAVPVVFRGKAISDSAA